MKSAVALAIVLAACGSDGPPPDDGWMTSLDDGVSLSALSIPGTHESAALYEPLDSGTAKCQNMTLAEQLKAGVRYFDIRCRHIDDGFQIYHGPFFEQQTFDEVLSTMFAFLDQHPQQVLIMSVKEEFTADNTTRSFADTFQAYVDQEPDRWYLGDSIPTVGDARGKIVLMRRFPSTTTPLGLDGSTWDANDTTFTLASPSARIRVQDVFKVDNIETKWSAVTALFDEAKAGDAATLYLNYTSGYKPTSGGIPNTPVVATEINSRLDTYYADPAHADGRIGTVASDFTTESRIRYVIAHNAL